LFFSYFFSCPPRWAFFDVSKMYNIQKMEEGFAKLFESVANKSDDEEAEAEAEEFIDNNLPTTDDLLKAAGRYVLQQHDIDLDIHEQVNKELIVHVTRALTTEEINEPPDADDDDEEDDDDDDEAAPEEEQEAAEPVQQRRRVEFDPTSFLEKLKPLCVAPVPVAIPIVAPAAPADATQQYLAGIRARLPRGLANPGNDFHDLILTGHYIKTAREIMGISWRQIRDDIGLPTTTTNVAGHSTVKRALALYDLVSRRGMQRLRYFKPTNKRMTGTVNSKLDALLAVLANDPAEAAWWSNNNAVIPTVMLTKQDQTQVPWIDSGWL
jgi:hypothetical protein